MKKVTSIVVATLILFGAISCLWVSPVYPQAANFSIFVIWLSSIISIIISLLLPILVVEHRDNINKLKEFISSMEEGAIRKLWFSSIGVVIITSLIYFGFIITALAYTVSWIIGLVSKWFSIRYANKLIEEATLK